MITTAALIVVRVSLLLGTAVLVATLLRRSSAAARHLVWTCALAGSLLVPIASLALPAWELPLLPSMGPRLSAIVLPPSPREQGQQARFNESSPVREGGGACGPRQAEAAPSPSNVDGCAVRDEPQAASPTTLSRPRTLRGSLPGVPGLPVSIWLIGVLFVLSRLALGTFRMWWVARRASRVSSGGWVRLAERLAGALGVGRRVVFLEGGSVAMPMTWGVFKARVLLPKAAGDWPFARKRVVLLHELAHVKRRDCLTQLVAQLACAVYWFNPLVWLAARRLRAERERACDDLVLASGTRGSDYADHLLEIARSMRSAMLPTWGAVAMAHRSQLEGRLMAILDPQVPRRFPSRSRSLALVSTMGVLLVPIALITPAPWAAESIASTGVVDSPTVPLATPSPSAAPRQAPSQASRASEGQLASAMRQAVNEAVPDATRDLAREGWLGAIVEGTLHAIGAGVGQAVGGVTGGISGGVAGGVSGGVAGGVSQETEREAEKETDTVPRDPRVVAALVDALKDSDKEVRESAMQALANMRAPEALGAIRASLKDANPSVRQQAAFALGQYRDRSSVDALGAALQDSSADVREQAVFALGQIRDSRAAEPLAQALKDADGSVREQAAFALGQLRSPDAVQPLTAALHDRSADVREQAAFALGQIRDRRAVEALVVALKDENADVREQAAFALGQLRDARATEGLTAALKDSNAEVRRQAAFALGQIAR
jgi:HEAT repeat protein/beta-lactamase regulating signal transducer with metallopeptidase domain